MPKTNPLIIDCDTGRDDALTIWLTLALDLPLAGVVTSYGNTILDNVTDNTARVLALAGRTDIPLLVGAREPSRPHQGYQHTVLSRQAISGNGLCNLDLPRSDTPLPEPMETKTLTERLRALAAKHGKLDYVIIGPATNFAALCKMMGREIHDIVAQVTMMGGKFDDIWAADPKADFNLICDPYAVQTIMEAGFAMRFVPMNATLPIQITLPEIEKLPASDPVGETAKALMIAHCKHFAPEPVFCFHDPSVVLAMLEPNGFSRQKLRIICNDQTPSFGQLSACDDGFVCQVYATTASQHLSFRKKVLEMIGLSD